MNSFSFIIIDTNKNKKRYQNCFKKNIKLILQSQKLVKFIYID